MAYDPHVVNAIRRIARKRGVPDRWLVGAFSTGIVESGLQDLAGGDADSYGFRQQRLSGYGRQSLNKQINNLFDEFGQFDKGQPIGELVADVQRPREDLRYKYGTKGVLSQAEKLAGGNIDLSGMDAGNGGVPGSPAGSGIPTPAGPNIFDTLGNLNASMPQTANQQQLQRGWQLLSELQAQKNTPSAGFGPTQQYTPGSQTPVSGGPKGSGLMELFFDPQGGWDPESGSNENIGAIGGHGDHVHVAANKRRLQWILKQAASGRFGNLHVGEAPGYGGSTPGVHTGGSHHDEGEAGDVSGDPKAENEFTSWLRRKYGLR